MKNTLKKIISCIITACLTIGIVNYAGYRLDPEHTEAAMSSIKSFHALDIDTLEVIIYGSSHAWRGCDPRVMYKKYGLAAYNYGCNWQAINTTLLFLQDSLRTQTPKIVCIEAYHVNTVKENTDMDGEIYYTKAISNFKGKKEYLKQCFGTDLKRYASYYMPLIMFHDNWNKINSENYRTFTSQNWFATMGYVSSDHIQPVSIENYLEFPQYELSDSSLEILDKMVKACKDKGVQIIFYTCPYEGKYKYYEAMEQYAAEHDCTYINLFEYMDDMGMDLETDFCDSGHLNDSGSFKVADFLGKYIVNNYNVNDMRTVKGNMWETYIE